MRYNTILSLCWGREHSPVFRQSIELYLIWLHDIPHILHQAQGQLFALTLTFLSSNALALTPPWLSCLVPCTNSLTKFTSSLPIHASCCIYLFLSLFLSHVLSCFILPYPANLMSLLSLPFFPAHSLPLSPFLPCPPFPCLSPPLFPPSLPSAVEVRYDAEPESSPVFNYINKTPCEVEWPRTPQPSLYPPHPSPFSHLSLPVVLQA